MRYTTVIFDLDGTILDTLDDLWMAVNAALASHGLPLRSREEVRRFVGDGVGRLISRAVETGTRGDVEAAVLKSFRAHYDAHGEDRTRPYDGINAMFDELARHNVRMGVVSNKYDGAVKRLVARYFPHVALPSLGDAPDRNRKPSPDAVIEMMRMLDADRESTLYVGDSDVDVLTARNAGVPCAAVLWGFRTKAELISAGAELFASSTQELMDIIQGGSL